MKLKMTLKNELGYSYIWTRLNEIENVFGDEYDLSELENCKKLDWNRDNMRDNKQ